MHRLNLTIDEALYEQATLILEADDEKEILEILANDKFVSNDNFKEKMDEFQIQVLKVDSRGDIYK